MDSALSVHGPARDLIASWLRNLASEFDNANINLPELYDEMATFLGARAVREGLPEYAGLVDPVAPAPRQPACGNLNPHKAHNGFATENDSPPWCTGVNAEGSGPDVEVEDETLAQTVSRVLPHIPRSGKGDVVYEALERALLREQARAIEAHRVGPPASASRERGCFS